MQMQELKPAMAAHALVQASPMWQQQALQLPLAYHDAQAWAPGRLPQMGAAAATASASQEEQRKCLRAALEAVLNLGQAWAQSRRAQPRLRGWQRRSPEAPNRAAASQAQ